MKHLNLLTLLLLIGSSVFSQSYFIKTAKKSGNWTSGGNWQVTPRTDGININEYIIPSNLVISLNANADLTDEGRVEITISGTLEIQSDRTLTLSNDSRITLTGGTITVDFTAKNEHTDKKNKKKEQIIIGNMVKYDGMTQELVSGNLFASQVTGAAPNGFISNAMLPVNFVSFNAAKINNASVAISWATTNEVNNNHFEIQRSTDGINWFAVAIMIPDTDGSDFHMYRYNDKFSEEGNVYYRIRQVDFDGKESFSKVKMIAGIKTASDANIFVSAKNTVTVNFKNSNENNVTIRLVNMNGTIIGQKTNNSVESISLTAYNALPGAYIVQVSDAHGMLSSKKVLL